MIEKWNGLSPKERLFALFDDIAEDYYRTREIDNIPEVITIKEFHVGRSSSLEFFRSAIHSSIPNQYLEEDIPIIGMGMMGRSIAFGENKALVKCISNNVRAIPLDRVDFKKLIEDAYKKIGSIGAIFSPIKFYTQIHEELDVHYRNGVELIKTDVDEIRMIYSNNLSKWEEIVILGSASIVWTRKLSPALPPNLSDYQIYSKEDEYLQSAYKITHDEALFIIGIVYNCGITDPKNVIVYSPPEE